MTPHKLIYQYRMTKGLYDIPNCVFYEGNIRIDYAVPDTHEKVQAFKHFLGKSIWNMTNEQVEEKINVIQEKVLIDLPHSQGFKEMGHHYLTNYSEAKCTADLICEFLHHYRSRVQSKVIAVIAFYKAHLDQVKEEIQVAND